MKKLLWAILAISFAASSAFPQSNKIVFGPLEGDDAGVLTVHTGESIEIEMWVRTDPDNPAPIIAIAHALMSEDDIIPQRNGVLLDNFYYQEWTTFFYGPYTHDPNDAFPIPEGHTCEIVVTMCDFGCDNPLDTQGEWDYFGAFHMATGDDVPIDQTYYPFSDGWFPEDGTSGTGWFFDIPPGGGIVPEIDYCGLHFEEPDPGLNKIVFGPLEGDDAGVLTVRNGENIGIELWVRTDPENPSLISGVVHGLMSENVIIAERNGMDPEPEYDSPPWEAFFIDGPFVHDPEDNFPIPPGWTSEIQGALCFIDIPIECLDTQGEWDLYGTWLMVTNSGIPVEQTYYPFMEGWWPHSGLGTDWGFYAGGGVVPEQSYCGLYFEPDTCIYIPGDVNRNGTPLELADVLAMIANYRGLVEPYYICQCSEDPPIFDFAATADPNGNCVPNQLIDVITEIAAYRGLAEASGCPDCPGSGPLLIGQNKDR